MVVSAARIGWRLGCLRDLEVKRSAAEGTSDIVRSRQSRHNSFVFTPIGIASALEKTRDVLWKKPSLGSVQADWGWVYPGGI